MEGEEEDLLDTLRANAEREGKRLPMGKEYATPTPIFSPNNDSREEKRKGEE